MKMLIEMSWGRVKVALVKDKLLFDYTEEQIDRGQLKGNIYKGVVTRVEPALQAAFVDIGEDRHAFIQAKDLHPRVFPESIRQQQPQDIQIQDALKRRQTILVQVTRDPIRNKGADLTCHISLAGRFLVFMPEEENAGGISRRIDNLKDRSRLRTILSKLNPPKASSVIVRTVGKGSNKKEFERDLGRLVRLWDKIRSDYDASSAPALLLREEDAAVRALRDYLTSDIKEVIIGSEAVASRLRDYVSTVMPRTRVKISVHRGNGPLMLDHGVEEQVIHALEPRVSLPSGGSIVIQATEALISVDVNSGKSTKGAGSAETALTTNLEAAEEIARQLRLRDLGGLIVIDFIDMESDKHRSEVERSIRNALKDDKARVSVGHISSFGMLELSRQRLRKSLWSMRTALCPMCQGYGRISNPVLSGEQAIDMIARRGGDSANCKISIEMDKKTASVLMNELRTAVLDLEKSLNISVRILISDKVDSPPVIVSTEPLENQESSVFQREIDLDTTRPESSSFGKRWKPKRRDNRTDSRNDQRKDSSSDTQRYEKNTSDSRNKRRRKPRYQRSYQPRNQSTESATTKENRSSGGSARTVLDTFKRVLSRRKGN